MVHLSVSRLKSNACEAPAPPGTAALTRPSLVLAAGERYCDKASESAARAGVGERAAARGTSNVPGLAQRGRVPACERDVDESAEGVLRPSLEEPHCSRVAGVGVTQRDLRPASGVLRERYVGGSESKTCADWSHGSMTS